MANVSELAWNKTDHGICPICHRDDIDIGKLNIFVPGEHPIRCIDCFFGMPCDLWPEEMWTDYKGKNNQDYDLQSRLTAAEQERDELTWKLKNA